MGLIPPQLPHHQNTHDRVCRTKRKVGVGEMFYQSGDTGGAEMSYIAKEIAGVEEFKNALFYQRPIPIEWAVWKYQAQQELLDQQAKEYAEERAAHNSHVTELLQAEAKIDQQAKEIETQRAWLKNAEAKENNYDNLRRMFDLAVKALERIHGIRETFPLGAYKHHLAKGFDRAEILSGKALEEIKRLGEGVNK